MKKSKIRFLICLGIACILLAAVSSWYSKMYNDARFVEPMDLSTYVFRIQDLPMIVSSFLVLFYVFYLFSLLVHAIIKNNQRNRTAKTTRKINPKLGFLGFFGFFGFTGFSTYGINGDISSFVFFIFFGFFGFFYEGKMSNTFMDERYKENKVKARLTSMEITMSVIFITTLALGGGDFMGNPKYTLFAVRIILPLTIALYMFLNEYLLYRYDHDDDNYESGD